jgi:hypothetical protein
MRRCGRSREGRSDIITVPDRGMNIGRASWLQVGENRSYWTFLPFTAMKSKTSLGDQP